MQEQLFSIALGIREPIYIEEIRFESGELHVFLNFYSGAEFACPQCGENRKVYDTMTRQWRHLNFFQYKTYLHFPTPRTDCSACGKRQVDIEWARPGSGFSLLFEAFAVALIKGGLTFAELGRATGEHDTRLRRIIDHYVEKAHGQKSFRKLSRVGIDETSSRKGHRYITVVTDHDSKAVVFATEGKGKDQIRQFANELEKHDAASDQIQEVSMDMSGPFMAGVADNLPNANITFDRFHVMKLLNEAVDSVRRSEVKTNELLKGTRYIWLKNRGNLTPSQIEKLQSLENENIDAARAYRLKLTFQDIYEHGGNAESAEILMKGWLGEAEASGLEPMIKCASTIRKHMTGVLRYFTSKLTAGISEGLNSIIGTVKRRAHGYRNMRNFINMIYLVAGNLTLPDYPLPA